MPDEARPWEVEKSSLMGELVAAGFRTPDGFGVIVVKLGKNSLDMAKEEFEKAQDIRAILQGYEDKFLVAHMSGGYFLEIARMLAEKSGMDKGP